MSKNTENAKLVPLFGRNNDMRVKLLVDELRNKFNVVNTGVQITLVTPAFQNQFFAAPDAGSSDTAVHSEWIAFGKALGARIGGKSASADVISIIVDNAGATDPSSEKAFVQALIRAILVVKKGTTVLANAASWATADNATYRSVADIADALFSSKNVELKKITDAIKTGTADDAVREFGYRYDKFWLRAMLEGHASSAASTIAPSRFFDDEVAPSEEVYFRKGSELYTYDATGKEVRVDAGSDAFKSLKFENKCLGTGLNDSGAAAGAKCADYLRDCLSGKNVQQCKAYLMDDKYWDKAVDEVNAMLPAMAVQTLNAFEFTMEQVWDNTAARRLLKYKSVDSWLANLTSMAKATPTPAIDEKAVEQIAKNTKLIGYLRMLVKKVNSNPAILNKDYSGPTDSARINDPDAFAGSRLYKMGVKGRVATPTLSVSSIDKLSQTIKDANARVSISFGFPNVYGLTHKVNLVGGGVVEDLEEKASDITKHTGHIIERQFLALNARLKRYGKDISKADFDKIVNLIDSLKSSEEKLYKANLYTEKYARLLEVHGEKDNTSVLTMDHLKEFVDNRNKYFTRVSKKQNDLMSIIRSIAEAVNKETPSTEAEMKNLDVDSKSVDFTALLG